MIYRKNMMRFWRCIGVLQRKLLGGQKSRAKSVKKIGCVISGFLFSHVHALAMDWIMRKAKADKRRGIWWNFTMVLADVDFADDIALLSSKFNGLHERTEEEAAN